MKRCLLLLSVMLLMVGCGTTGKEYTVKFDIKNNTNTVVKIDPTISSESGDSANTSANKTAVPFDVPISVGLDSAADLLEGKINRGVVDSITGKDKPKKEPVEPEPIVEPEKVDLTYIGRHNGDLPSWQMAGSPPAKFLWTVEGCFKDLEVVYDGERFQKEGTMTIVRPSETPGRTAFMTDSTCKSEKSWIRKPSAWKAIESHNLVGYEDKSFHWLDRQGKDYPAPVKVVFSGNKGTILVPDPSKHVWPDGRDGLVYFAHDPHTPGKMNGRGSVFTRKGEVAETVTIYAKE